VRALTVRQPWAWAIVEGGKHVENRSRGTTYRGPLAIHAALTWSARGASDPRVLAAWDPAGLGRGWGPDDFPAGAVIGVVDLVDAHPAAGCCEPWGEAEYSEANGRTVRTVHHLVLEQPRALPEPIPARGALGLWTPPRDLIDRLTAEETRRA